MSSTATVFRQASASVMTRAAFVGWVAWCLFIVTAGVVAIVALLERHRGFCSGPGEAGRDWAFELFPFGQTCVVAGATTPDAPTAVVQTASVYLLLVVALAATVFILTSSRLRSMSRLAVSLMVAQLASIVLAGIILLFKLVTNDAPPPLNGIDLGLVFDLIVALGVATVTAAMAFGGSTLVNVGKTSI